MGKGAGRGAPARNAASFLQRSFQKVAAKRKKGKNKGGKGGRSKGSPKGRGRGTKAWTPVTIPGNQNICAGFNVGKCEQNGASCDRGLHVCNRLTKAGKHCGCKKGAAKCFG